VRLSHSDVLGRHLASVRSASVACRAPASTVAKLASHRRVVTSYFRNSTLPASGLQYQPPVTVAGIFQPTAKTQTRANVSESAPRWAPLGERWFADLCFFGDARAGLVSNAHAVLDAHVFGDTFEASLEAFRSWDTVRLTIGVQALTAIFALSSRGIVYESVGNRWVVGANCEPEYEDTNS